MRADTAAGRGLTRDAAARCGRARARAGRRTVELRPFGQLPGRSSIVNVTAGGMSRLVVRLNP